MVTYLVKGTNSDGSIVYEMCGLSEDEKPTKGVGNGSIFVEMNTGVISFYDSENKEWHPLG